MSTGSVAFIRSFVADIARRFMHKQTVFSTIEFPVYLINLQRSPERRAFALSQMENYGVLPEIIWAVDGKELDCDVLIKEGVYSREKSNEAFSRQLSLSEIGCSWSHINIYKKMLEDGKDVALVLEDDALLLPHFVNKLNKAYKELPSGWGVLHLNCPCESFVEVDENLVKYDGAGPHPLPVASSAYLISNKGAEYFLKKAFPIRYPADSFIGRGLRWGVETYGVKTPITSINNVFQSYIYDPDGLTEHVKHWIKKLASRLLHK